MKLALQQFLIALNLVQYTDMVKDALFPLNLLTYYTMLVLRPVKYMKPE